MEMELNSLIDKIKTEGVEEAQKNAADIIAQAEKKAEDIIARAEQKKKEMLKEAERENENFKKASIKALNQSARDVLLTLRERVSEFFNRLLKDDIKGAMTQDTLKKAILEAIKNFRKDAPLDIEVLVSKKDRDLLERSLFRALTKDIKNQVTLTPAKGVDKGFRIGTKGKESYYDFTDEAITEAFKKYLNPKLSKLLDIELNKGKKK